MPNNTGPGDSRPVIVVTGAARGIGWAIAQRFLQAGWRVGALDRDAPALNEAVAAWSRDDARDHARGGGKDAPAVVALVADVSVPTQVDAAIAAAVARFGRLDALVNNAGIAVFKPASDTGFDEWRAVMATNLDGAFLCSQAALPHLKTSGAGSVVHIASISGLRASTLRVAYGTSKAALMHLARQQAAEWGEFGVRVNVVAPGPVDTAMALQVHTPAIRRAYRDAIPLARYGTPEEIAAAVFFLCSDQAAYVTGQTLAVDGGFEAAGIGLPALRGEDAP
jgi:meso-butanediol dehydrogenase / (S,S)-butanediol dehydrogenase / diacetyl reductase